jgi:hypothetical protein
VDRKLPVNADGRAASIKKHLEDSKSFIARLSRETLDEAVANLGERDDYPLTFGTTAGEVEIVLGSRRFSRLLELIALVPEDRRSQAAQNCFVARMERAREHVDRVIAIQKDPQTPRVKGSLLGNRLGIVAALFAVATYVRIDIVCDDIVSLRDFEHKTIDRLKVERLDPSVQSLVVNTISIPAEVEGNVLLVNAFEANCNAPAITEDVRELRSALRRAVAAFPRSKISVFPSQTTIIGTDMLHWGGGLPVTGTGKELVLVKSLDAATVDRLIALVQALHFSREVKP